MTTPSMARRRTGERRNRRRTPRPAWQDAPGSAQNMRRTVTRVERYHRLVPGPTDGFRMGAFAVFGDLAAARSAPQLFSLRDPHRPRQATFAKEEPPC